MQNYKKVTEEYFESKYEFSMNDELGQGSFGAVYKAKDKTKNEIVALKVITKLSIDKIKIPDQKERMLRYIDVEVELLKKCECENSVKLIDALETEKKYYLVLEYCDTDLSRYLYSKKGEKGLSADKIRDIFNKFNQVLIKKKESHIVHRDLKPENIMLKKDEKNGTYTPKLGNFGIGKELIDGITNTFVGTLNYMAPEKLWDENCDESADLWSIGIIIYELYFKSLLYDGENRTAILRQIQWVIPLKIEENEDINDLIDRLLQYEPRKKN